MPGERDFVIDLVGGPSRYRLHVSGPAGDDDVEVELDPAGLGADLDNLQAKVLASATVNRGVVGELERPLRQVGKRLYDAVFRNSAGELFVSSRDEVERADERLRIVLRLRAPELAALPWELLFSERHGGYLCRRGTMVRYVDAAEPVRPLTVTPPLRVLGMTALPGDLATLDADTERDRLTSLLEPLKERGLVSLEWVSGQSWHAAQEALYKGCHVFHFIGHGGFDEQRQEGMIAFADRRGRPQMIRAAALAELLSVADPTPRLVVLNSCETARGSAADVFAGTAATLVRTVPAVVAMQFAITDQAAAEFSFAFYQAVVYNRGVDEAMRTARIALTGWNQDTLEWVTPVLYLRSRDSHLFKITDTATTPAPEREPMVGRAEVMAAYWAAQTTGNWEPVLARLATLRAQFPEDQELARVAADARLAARYTQGRLAEDDCDWGSAVGHYEAVRTADPGYRDVTDRFTACSKARDVADLQGQLRSMYNAGNLEAVLGIDQRLFEMDPTAADPDGLATRARERLAGTESTETDRRSTSKHRRETFDSDSRWAEALTAYYARRYDEAVNCLEVLQASYPDAARIQARLEKARRDRDLDAWSAAADTAAERGEWADAIATLRRVIEVDSDYRDARGRLERVEAAERRQALVEEITALHQAGQWQGVLAAGEELARVDPQHPDPRGMLADARTQLAAADLAARYSEALCRIDDEQWEPAADLLNAIQLERPGYRDIEALLATVQQHLEPAPAPWQQPPPPPPAPCVYVPAPRTLDIGRPVRALAISPDGSRLATGSERWICVWNLHTGQKVWERKAAGPLMFVLTVAYSPDGTQIATGGSDCTARIWDAATGRQRLQVRHLEHVRSVAFSPDGTQLATGSNDMTARIWDAVSGAQLLQITHHDRVRAVAFSPDGTRIATGANDMTARVLDAVSGAELLQMGHAGAVCAVAFSPDGTQVATGSDDMTGRVWDTASGLELVRVTHDDQVRAVAFSPDGAQMATGSDDKAARIWDLASGGQLLKLTHGGAVFAVAFSPDGSRIASGGTDRTARISNAATGATLLRVTHDDWVSAVAFNPDGTRLATGSGDATVRTWDTTSGAQLLQVTHTGCWVFGVDFSPDGTLLATGSDDMSARILDAGSGAQLLEMSHAGTVGAVAFSPDGTQIATGSNDKTARIWDTTNGLELLRIKHGNWVRAVAFSPDSRQILTGSGDGTARIWDTTSGLELLRVEHGDWVRAVAFSPSGALIATGSDDKALRIGDAASGRLLLKLTHGGAVFAVAFSPDGTKVATGSNDKTARVWDVASGRLLLKLTHGGAVFAVAFSPDGTMLASGSGDMTARIWDVT